MHNDIVAVVVGGLVALVDVLVLQPVANVNACMTAWLHQEGSIILGDHKGSILSNRAETSQEGYCGRQREEISAQSISDQEKTNP